MAETQPLPQPEPDDQAPAVTPPCEEPTPPIEAGPSKKRGRPRKNAVPSEDNSDQITRPYIAPPEFTSSLFPVGSAQNLWQFLEIIGFFSLFDEQISFTDIVDPISLAQALDEKEGKKMEDIIRRMLGRMSRARGGGGSAPPQDWERSIRARLGARASALLPPHPASFEALDPSGRILLLQALVHACVEQAPGIAERTAGIEPHRLEAVRSLRIEPIAQDSRRQLYYHFPAFPAFVFREPAPRNGETDGEPATEPAGPWSTVTASLGELEHLELCLRRSEEPGEKELREYLVEEVIPPLQELRRREELAARRQLYVSRYQGVDVRNIVTGERERTCRSAHLFAVAANSLRASEEPKTRAERYESRMKRLLMISASSDDLPEGSAAASDHPANGHSRDRQAKKKRRWDWSQPEGDSDSENLASMFFDSGEDESEEYAEEEDQRRGDEEEALSEEYADSEEEWQRRRSSKRRATKNPPLPPARRSTRISAKRKTLDSVEDEDDEDDRPIFQQTRYALRATASNSRSRRLRREDTEARKEAEEEKRQRDREQERRNDEEDGVELRQATDAPPTLEQSAPMAIAAPSPPLPASSEATAKHSPEAAVVPAMLPPSAEPQQQLQQQQQQQEEEEAAGTMLDTKAAPVELEPTAEDARERPPAAPTEPGTPHVQ